MPSDDRLRDVDVVLDPTQYAHILDSTKGTVICHVGPTRLDLADKDKPVLFADGKFVRCSRIDEAIQSFPVVPEGGYVILVNPAKNDSHPDPGKGNSAVELNVGRIVVVRGPTTFPLWPGQEAQVVQGHRLRSNQYLIARVINEDDAKKNWKNMVARPSEESGEVGKTGNGESDEAPESVKSVISEGLTLGKEIVIKGTEVSFFIPPTGMTVVQAEQSSHYVRDAVTLERLEYCILVDEDGNKRFERGPQVVFPRPTEKFVTTPANDGKVSRKFRAVELNEINGIHVKVIADYTEGEGENETTHKEGDELFITGKEQKIYFPRPEHAIIKYGAQERHFAVAIPEGEARYVLDRLSGKIATRTGPDMALLDPRNEVFVRRILDPKTVGLWFPGNQEALDYNKSLSAFREGSSEYARERAVRKTLGGGPVVGASVRSSSPALSALDSLLNYVGDAGDVAESYAQSERAVSEIAGDEITRREKFTPPRALTLDNTKYEGAILINVWTGYAVQVVSKTGDREVVVGPKPRLLNYDESLEAVSLSTGTPKSFTNPLRTVYLRVENNRVSDEITAETEDLVRVTVKLAMRVNFMGDPNRWFSVENYVGLLSERVRSILRSKIKRVKVRDFMRGSVDMIREFLLGAHPEVADVKEGETAPAAKRPGLVFAENNMRLSDVEVLDVHIGDSDIDELLQETQHDTVRTEIQLEQAERELSMTKKQQDIARQRIEEDEKTQLAKIKSDRKIADESAANALASVQRGIEKANEELTLTQSRESIADEQAKRTDARDKILHDREAAHLKALEDIAITGVKERGMVAIDKIKAIQPDLIAAMQVLGDKMLTVESVKELGAVAALTGESVEGVFKRLMQGSVLADVFVNSDGNKPGLVAKALERAGLRRATTSGE